MVRMGHTEQEGVWGANPRWASPSDGIFWRDARLLGERLTSWRQWRLIPEGKPDDAPSSMRQDCHVSQATVTPYDQSRESPFDVT
jgi:hypothetical protein